jgi:hypothetical protein
VDFTCLTKKHENTEPFPYSETQLANALQFLCENSGLVTHMQEKDEATVPEFKDSTESDDWHAEKELERKNFFESLLQKAISDIGEPKSQSF